MTNMRYFIFLVLALSATALAAGCATSAKSRPLEQALVAAGSNRTELEQAITHYQKLGDPDRLAAVRFLVENMPGHGYTVAVFYDSEKNEVPFHALDYASYDEAVAAFDKLKKEHGSIDYGRKAFITDIETITASYLIQNIELAFRAREQKPWAKNVEFDTFLHFVLPYRGSNEPVNDWRRPCLERYAGIEDKLDGNLDLTSVAEHIRNDVNQWVRFDPIYYLHPTDQGFDEMNERGMGRCEDISNMMAYAMRANGIPCTTDYTPYWADRDNNHAWEVVLDEHGRGHAGLSNRAAKVYRKTFAAQPDSLSALKTEDENAPRWLNIANYIDVTEQYCETSDVKVTIDTSADPSARFAYLCVFNAGQWRPIHWGWIRDGQAHFTAMGRNIAYLPALYVDKQVKSAGQPFILTTSGDQVTLDPNEEQRTAFELTGTKPETPDADTGIQIPRLEVKPGRPYELFIWDNGWQSLGTKEAGVEPVAFKDVPAGGLYWLVEEGSRHLERIFTIEDNTQVWW